MDRRLNSKEQEMVLKNKNLVHSVIQQLGIKPYSKEYEDIVSIGTIGLIKAVLTFDDSKNIKFSSYAGICIRNEVFMYCRKAKKYAKDIFLNDIIGKDNQGNEITLGEVLENPNSNFIKGLLDKEDLVRLISIILNCLKDMEKIIILLRISGKTQKEICEILNRSRSYISRLEMRIRNKIINIFDLKIPYKEAFYVAIKEELIIISFLHEDINKVNANLLKKRANEMPFNFKIVSNENNEKMIEIQFPAESDSFYFIAQLFM